MALSLTRRPRRFDFFFQELSITDKRLQTTSRFCYFFPERAAPDLFYSTMEDKVDFADFVELEPFRFHMDDAGDWVTSIYAVLSDYIDDPRAPGVRPSRAREPSAEGVPGGQLRETSPQTPPPAARHDGMVAGYARYSLVAHSATRKFHRGIMNACGER